MSVENKPTQPVLITPAGGSEISNLNPVINIQFTQSTDVYYLDNIETTTKVPSDGDLETGTNDVFGGPQNWIGFFYDHINITSGRVGKIKLKFSTFNGRNAELWEATRNSREDGAVTLGTLIHSGPIGSDGSFDIPYEKAKRIVGAFLFRVKVGNSLYVLPKAGDFTDHLGEDVAENNLYSYDSNWGVYDADKYQMGLLADIYMYGGHNDDICYEVELTTDNGQTWKSLANGIYGEPVLQYDFTEEIENNNTYLARVRVRAQDDNHFFPKGWTIYHQPIYREPNYTEWSVSEPFTIIKHTNPQQPTNLIVSDTGIIDKNIVNRLKWKHNHDSINNRQGKADIRWRVQGQIEWNLITADGMSQFYDVPADTFPIGLIEWQVMTYSYVMLESPWSEIILFEAKDTPAGPIIASPVGTVEVTSPYAIWEHNYIQTHYQIQILSLSDFIIWDSGQVSSSLFSRKIDWYFDNLTTFKVSIRVKNSDGLWSEWTTGTFETNYKYPAPATVEAIAKDGYITIAYENGAPTGAQPFTDRNEVYKSLNGTDWDKISEGYVFQFDDYAAPNDVEVRYFVRSYAANGAFTDSEVVTATVKIRGVVLYLVNDPVGTLYRFKIDGHGRSKNWNIESAIMHFKGRKHPVIEVGMMESDTIDFTLMLNEEDKLALDKIIYSGQICCYRDGRGRISHGIFTEYPLVDERWGGYSVQLSLTKIDYIETV